MAEKYFLTKDVLIGGYAIKNYANSFLTSTAPWTITMDANTSIIRIYTDNAAYFSYGNSVSSNTYDYYIPSYSSVDLYNYPAATIGSFVADTANCNIKVTCY